MNMVNIDNVEKKNDSENEKPYKKFDIVCEKKTLCEKFKSGVEKLIHQNKKFDKKEENIDSEKEQSTSKSRRDDFLSRIKYDVKPETNMEIPDKDKKADGDSKTHGEDGERTRYSDKNYEER